ncbi:hypothetical protein GF406_06430 [candidate division KSB1 bacterium]|nr:hypothetical protein [candidate division KSB1 bacterium]
MGEWTLNSWQNYVLKQQPVYPDSAFLMNVLQTLSSFSGIVRIIEIEYLKTLLSQHSHFILQAGDCAETFDDCHSASTSARVRCLLRMRSILETEAKLSVLILARMAGQYAKPRSFPAESINGLLIPSYRGDLIHSFLPSASARIPDPKRLLLGYYFSKRTLCQIKSIFNSASPNYLLDQSPLMAHKFFTSHEALHLRYEQSMTRKDLQSNRYYNLGAHLVWLGERTRFLTSGHVEYLRGIENPLGIKIGPSCDITELEKIIQILNPQNQAGKLILILRLGIKECTNKLPHLLQRLKSYNVSWICDPMHGNTIKMKNEIKTRYVHTILQELIENINIFHKVKMPFSGIHLETACENVTECVGLDVSEKDLIKNYLSYCDPRLNPVQFKYLILGIVKHLGKSDQNAQRVCAMNKFQKQRLTL